MREVGLEPTRPRALEPKSSASANSATRAHEKCNPTSAFVQTWRMWGYARLGWIDTQLTAQARHVPGGLDVVQRQEDIAILTDHHG